LLGSNKDFFLKFSAVDLLWYCYDKS